MEEVDSIILHFLQQLNINIEDTYKNVCDMPLEIIIESVSKCLNTINPLLKIPSKLPSGISQRIEVAAQIASFCKDLGYKNDVGYQTFLYYNEAELRQVFMFLIEKLPSDKQQSNINKVPKNSKTLLLTDVCHKINEDLHSIWIPPCCNESLKKDIGDSISGPAVINISSIDLSEAEIVAKLKRIKRMPDKKNISNKSTDHDNGEHEKEGERVLLMNKTLKELKETSIVLRQQLDALESDKHVMDVEYSQALKSCERIEADFKNVQTILNGCGLTNNEIDNVPGNILEKVQNSINKLHRKSEDVTLKNLTLKATINKLKNNVTLSESERTKCIKILITLKETAKTMKEEYDKKDNLKNQLIDTYEKLRYGNKRSIYTKRILEIISNVDKQNMEIKKILEDTRQLQKEINSLEGQLDRCFSVADETLFKDAKKDDQAKKAYKLLALLHSECNTIVSLVNDTGSLARDIVDLEDNIKAEKVKRTEDTLLKIQQDLARLQEESEHLT